MFFLPYQLFYGKIVYYKALISRINMKMSVRGRENSSKKDMDVVLHPSLEILAEETSVIFRDSRGPLVPGTQRCSRAQGQGRALFTVFSVAENLHPTWEWDPLLFLFICASPNNAT